MDLPAFVQESETLRMYGWMDCLIVCMVCTMNGYHVDKNRNNTARRDSASIRFSIHRYTHIYRHTYMQHLGGNMPQNSFILASSTVHYILQRAPIHVLLDDTDGAVARADVGVVERDDLRTTSCTDRRGVLAAAAAVVVAALTF